MSDHFNQLTAAEDERLALLSEECAEVIQVIAKIQRHGYDSRHPSGGPINRALLEQELGDIYSALRMLAEAGDVQLGTIEANAHAKSIKVKQYLHHQERTG